MASIAKNTQANVAPSKDAPSKPEVILVIIRLAFSLAVSFKIRAVGVLLVSGLKTNRKDFRVLIKLLMIFAVAKATMYDRFGKIILKW